MTKRDLSTLRRKINPMPENIRKILEEKNLMEAYLKRPPYQQNDYIGWIGRAVHEETRERRLKQMIEELELGNLYMNMEYHQR